jgi:hypothetical protein
MPVKTILLGKYDNIPYAEFGTGDISICKSRLVGDPHQSMIILYNQEPKEVGYEGNEWKGKNTNDLPEPNMILRFTRPESITALVHSLMEIQQEFFKTHIEP